MVRERQMVANPADFSTFKALRVTQGLGCFLTPKSIHVFPV